MSKADEALKDVRGWLCDNLSDGDAGKMYSMCRMLYVVSRHANELEEENDKLRNRLERLLTILRNDCDISVSWDGLRGFWNVELTEDGCLMRDRACKAEAENDKLRELVQYILDENYGDDWFCMKAKEFCLEARY